MAILRWVSWGCSCLVVEPRERLRLLKSGRIKVTKHLYWVYLGYRYHWRVNTMNIRRWFRLGKLYRMREVGFDESNNISNVQSQLWPFQAFGGNVMFSNSRKSQLTSKYTPSSSPRIQSCHYWKLSVYLLVTAISLQRRYRAKR